TFDPGAKSMAQAFDEMAAWMLEMVERRIKAPVPVWYGNLKKKQGEWLELDPREIEGVYRVQHVIEPVIPLERQQKAMLLADAQARGAVDMNTYREDGLGIDDPERMEDKVLIEIGLNRPETWEIIMANVRRETGHEVPNEQAVPQGALPPTGPPLTTQMAGIQQPLQPGISPEMAAPPNPQMTPNPNGVPQGV
ncbi:MAG TPA: hypothetical protein VEI97_01715, partial [bacterium]|nr:hypothetical protein [bacterium]